jgi:hypothetical protein
VWVGDETARRTAGRVRPAVLRVYGPT